MPAKTKARAGKTDADFCRARGWRKGTRLVGYSEIEGEVVIVITAIGEEEVLARALSYNGVTDEWPEASWTFSCRKWRKSFRPYRHTVR